MIEKYVNKVFHSDALSLLRALPPASIDAVITDAMYGTSKCFHYEWGVDPAQGDPIRHWRYHQPIYRECIRVLRPGGILAWGQGAKFVPYFHQWFGDHRVWTLTRFANTALLAIGNIWIVQTREQQPIDFPPRDSLVMFDRIIYLPLRKDHPCPKPIEELAFMITSLTKPGEIVLDCFCGLGSTLMSASALHRKWIGCDLSKRYCQITMKRLAESKSSAGESSGCRWRA